MSYLIYLFSCLLLFAFLVFSSFFSQGLASVCVLHINLSFPFNGFQSHFSVVSSSFPFLVSFPYLIIAMAHWDPWRHRAYALKFLHLALVLQEISSMDNFYPNWRNLYWTGAEFMKLFLMKFLVTLQNLGDIRTFLRQVQQVGDWWVNFLNRDRIVYLAFWGREIILIFLRST